MVGNMKRTYTEEFKKQAVELANSLDNTMSAAKQLGIGDSLIHAWKSKYENSGPADLTSEIIELKRLRKENAELKKVNYILKAAAAFFSQDHLK